MKNKDCLRNVPEPIRNEFSLRNPGIEKIVLENFSVFLNDYFQDTSIVDPDPYREIIRELTTGDDRTTRANRELVANYFLPGNEIHTGYFPYPGNDALRVLLRFIRTWVYREWKEKTLDLNHFLTINRLKESEFIPDNNRVHLKLIVLENQFVMPSASLPYFLIDLICPETYEMFSIKVKEYFSETANKAVERKNGGINIYMLALKAKPGDRLKLSGKIQRVYRDTKWNALCKRLKNLRGIRFSK